MRKLIAVAILLTIATLSIIVLSHGVPLYTTKPHMQRGTAWAINNQGYWMTAKHSVQNCYQTILLENTHNLLSGQIAIDPVRGLKALNPAKVIYTHPDYDLALIKGPPIDVPLLWSNNILSPQIGQKGYVIGYPGGVKGYLEVVYQGRDDTIVRHNNKAPISQHEVVHRWEVISTHLPNGRIGGISGAPIISENGEVVGVMTAQNGMLKSILASKPINIKELINSQIPANPTKALPPQDLTPEDIFKDLTKRRTISKLYCSKDF